MTRQQTIFSNISSYLRQASLSMCSLDKTSCALPYFIHPELFVHHHYVHTISSLFTILTRLYLLQSMEGLLLSEMGVFMPESSCISFSKIYSLVAHLVLHTITKNITHNLPYLQNVSESKISDINLICLYRLIRVSVLHRDVFLPCRQPICH